MSPTETRTFIDSRDRGYFSKVHDFLKGMLPRCDTALAGSGTDSLAGLKKKKDTSKQDGDEIAKHIKGLEAIRKVAKAMFEKITKLRKSDPDDYVDMNALIKAHAAFFEAAAEFQKSALKFRPMLRDSSKKFFYAMKGSFPNGSMNSIDQAVEDIVTNYRQMMFEFGFRD